MREPYRVITYAILARSEGEVDGYNSKVRAHWVRNPSHTLGSPVVVVVDEVPSDGRSVESLNGVLRLQRRWEWGWEVTCQKADE